MIKWLKTSIFLASRYEKFLKLEFSRIKSSVFLPWKIDYQITGSNTKIYKYVYDAPESESQFPDESRWKDSIRSRRVVDWLTIP